jgi:hypothetical protein
MQLFKRGLLSKGEAVVSPEEVQLPPNIPVFSDAELETFVRSGVKSQKLTQEGKLVIWSMHKDGYSTREIHAAIKGLVHRASIDRLVQKIQTAKKKGV